MGDRVSTSSRLSGMLAALFALVGSIGVINLSAGQIWCRTAPDAALRFWPSSSEAKAQKAAQLVADPGLGLAARRESDALARAALAIDPTNVVAMRTRGLIAGLAHDVAAARRWMTASQSLSRRDLPTQLWFIEDAVAQDDIDGALVHYDRALRTSRRAPDLLYPVLISATSEPEVATKLADLLASRPGWWGTFTNRLIGETADPKVLIPFVHRLRLTPADSAHPDFFTRILQRLVMAGEFEAADRLYRKVGQPGAALLQDGGFENGEGVLPFAWRLVDDGDLAGRIEVRTDGPGRALFLDARNGRSGEVARQAVALAPGQYLLRATGGGDAGAGPLVRVKCGSGTASDLAILAFPQSSGAPRSLVGGFVVPADCLGVWIGIEAHAGFDTPDDRARPWIDDMSITQLTAATVSS